MSIKNILHESDKKQVWSNQEAPLNISKLLKLIERYKILWKESVFQSPKCLNYRIFKYNFGFEKYLGVLPDDLALAFFHFRSLNHKFPIEWGRYEVIARGDRICELCSLHTLDAEYHYVLECSYFDDLRSLYLPRDLFSRPNTVKFENPMCSSDTRLFKVSKYCKVVLKTFQEIFRNHGQNTWTDGLCLTQGVISSRLWTNGPALLRRYYYSLVSL